MIGFKFRRYCLTYPNSVMNLFWTLKGAESWHDANPHCWLYVHFPWGWKKLRDGK